MFLRRKIAGIVAGVMSVACLAQLPYAITTNAVDSYSMNVTVDLKGDKKTISPLIYGVNDFGSTGNYRNTKVNAVRQGGNRYTGYNWETNWSNAGEDWQHSSDTHLGDEKNGPAYAVRRLSEETSDYDVSYKLATLQMAGYVAADKKGSVKKDEAAPGERWYEVKAKKDGELSLEPDTTDKVVYMDEYVNYIVNKLGDASTKTGIQGYSLDNEPFLWNDTHPLIHSEECGADELIDKSIELAKVVKDIDPKAEVFGPAVWGMLPCITAGDSEKSTDPVWAEKKANYDWYVDYYLERMAKAEKETGKRLLDVFDVHYYSQDCSTDDGALQAARSLYDESYHENSWLQQEPFNKYFPFITKLQESIKKYYPGTKLAVSEYNLANIGNEKVTGKNVVSAIAEVETLGAFADNDVYFATYWGTLPECPYVESAINLYTNYDGKGGAFGDTLVKTTSEDVSKSAAYAAIKGTDDSNVDVILSNKNKTEAEKAVISVEGSSKTYKSAVVYAVTQDHSDIRIAEVRNDVNGNKVEIELPPLSVAHIVLSDKETDAKVYEAPNITVKETVYNVSDLKTDAYGNVLIPLGDKEHLKEFVFGVNCSSTEGSAYYSGGGGLGFPQLVPEGGSAATWGFKAVAFSNGMTEIVVPFSDGIFTIDEKEVKATCNDKEAQWQPDWWKYSEKKGDGGDDVVVEYTTVKLVYEYDNDTETVPTETPTEAAPSTEATTVETTPSTESTPTEGTTAETVPTEARPAGDYIYGDVDLSGAVDLADVTMLSKYLMNKTLYNLEDKAKEQADVTHDKEIDSRDLSKIIEYNLGELTANDL